MHSENSPFKHLFSPEIRIQSAFKKPNEQTASINFNFSNICHTPQTELETDTVSILHTYHSMH